MKQLKQFLFLTLLMSINSILLYSQVDINKGLVAYYPFNGNANDESGNGNNGTVNGATLTADRFGKGNSAYLFTNTNNVTISSSSTLNNPETEITISYWIKVNSFSGTALSAGIVRKINDWGMYLVKNNPSSVDIGSFSNYQTTNMQPSEFIANWNHIVLVASNTTKSIYINGVLASSKTDNQIVSLLQANSNNDFVIGADNDLGIQNNEESLIDDIRIYSRVLNKDEIQALYNEGVCYQKITVTDTLLINLNMTSLVPLTYENTIKVFPNPSSDKINIDFGSNYSSINDYTIKIINANGQEFYNSPIKQQFTTLDILKWSGKGIYYINIYNSKKELIDVRKIILQ